MHINKVELHNFRNYENQEIKLKKNKNDNNGQKRQRWKHFNLYF